MPSIVRRRRAQHKEVTVPVTTANTNPDNRIKLSKPGYFASWGMWQVLLTLALASEGVFLYFVAQAIMLNSDPLEEALGEKGGNAVRDIMYPTSYVLAVNDLIFNILTFGAIGAGSAMLALKNGVPVLEAFIPSKGLAAAEKYLQEDLTGDPTAKLTTAEKIVVGTGATVIRIQSLISYYTLALADSIAINDWTKNDALRTAFSYITFPILGMIFYQQFTDNSYFKFLLRGMRQIFSWHQYETPSSWTQSVKNFLSQFIIGHLLLYPAAFIETIKQSAFNAAIRTLSATSFVYWLSESMGKDSWLHQPATWLKFLGTTNLNASMAASGTTTGVSCLTSRTLGPVDRFFNPKYFRKLYNADGTTKNEYFQDIQISLGTRVLDGITALGHAGGFAVLSYMYFAPAILTKVYAWLTTFIESLPDQPTSEVSKGLNAGITVAMSLLLFLQSYVAYHNNRNWDAALEKVEQEEKEAKAADSNDVATTTTTTTTTATTTTTVGDDARAATESDAERGQASNGPSYTYEPSKLWKLLVDLYKSKKLGNTIVPFNVALDQLTRMWLTVGLLTKLRDHSEISGWFPKSTPVEATALNYALVFGAYIPILLCNYSWFISMCVENAADIAARIANGLSPWAAPDRVSPEKFNAMLYEGERGVTWGWPRLSNRFSRLFCCGPMTTADSLLRGDGNADDSDRRDLGADDAAADEAVARLGAALGSDSD